MPEYISNEIEISSDNSDREVCYKENSDKEKSDEENFNEEN